MYNVLIHFHDLQDVDKKTKSGPIYHEYSVGDTYPREGLKPSQERIDELSGGNNAFGTPIIEAADKVVDDNDDPPTGETPAEGEGTGEPPAEGEGTGEPPAEGEGTGETPEDPDKKSGGKKASK